MSELGTAPLSARTSRSLASAHRIGFMPGRMPTGRQLWSHIGGDQVASLVGWFGMAARLGSSAAGPERSNPPKAASTMISNGTAR